VNPQGASAAVDVSPRSAGPLARLAPAVSSRALAASPALWLTTLILLSTLFRYEFARATAAPSIFPDELVYLDLARNLAHGGSFPAWSFGPLYPILIAPIFVLTSHATVAYAAVKLVNCVLVSLAAVPAYLLARRLLERRPALLFATTVLLVPSLVYSTRVMTESLAYPLFLWAVLAIQRAVERPSVRRQVEALALIVLVILARPQMLVLLPAFAGAVVAANIYGVPGERERPSRVLERLRPYRVLWSTLAGLGALGLALWGLTELGLLHGPALKRGDVSLAQLHLVRVPGLFVDHLAEIDLASGVVPFAATLLLLGRFNRLRRRLRTFTATAVSVAVWTLALAAFYTSQMPQTRIYERYVMYLSPLFVLALFAWAEQGVPRPRGARAYVAVAALLPLAIPFAAVLGPREWGVSTSTVGLVPWALTRLALDSLTPLYIATGIVGLGCAVLVLTARRSRTGRLTAFVVTYLAAVGLVVNCANFALAGRTADLGVAREESSWVDRIVGDRAGVAAIWTGRSSSGWHSGMGIWENMFFNRSVQVVYTLRGDFRKWAATPLTLRGTLATDGGKPVKPPYVLADPTTEVRGAVLGRDRCTGMTLYRVRGPLHVRLVPASGREQRPPACA
jgi:hypothetical protein